MAYHTVYSRIELPAALSELIIEAAMTMVKQSAQAFRVEPRRLSRGKTLRPGRETPLWNELRAQLIPHLRRYGDQVNLGRVVGLPRQRINAFVTGGGQMPDAERTLQLLTWLIATRKKRRPS